MATARSLVVVAGAEPHRTDGLAECLRDEFTVRTAYATDDLLASLDGEVDVVLVDSDLPDFSPRRLRELTDESDANWQIGLLTDASTPTFRTPDGRETGDAVDDLADARVPTVERASEPVVRDAVERLGRRAYYGKRLDEYYDIAAEYARLDPDADGEPPADEGVDPERERERLRRHLDRLRADLADTFERLDGESVLRVALDDRTDE